QERADRATGQTLDGGDELRPHRTLQGVPLDSDQVGLPGRNEVSLGPVAPSSNTHTTRSWWTKARDFVAPRPVKSAMSLPSSLASAAFNPPPDNRSVARDMPASHPSRRWSRSRRAERESTRAKRCEQRAYRRRSRTTAG